MTKLCICKICTCGRHHCPHRPAGGQYTKEPCKLSEYAQKYREHPMDRREPFKPNNEPVKGAGPMADATTNRVDYIPHAVERKYARPGEVYKKPDGTMDALSSYKKDYTEKPMSKPEAVRRIDRKVDGGKFEGQPTYKADYIKWPVGATRKSGPETMWSPPKNPFEGQSTTQRDYIGHRAAKQQSLKPDNTARMSDQPLDDNTNYRMEYRAHEFQPRERREPEKYRPTVAQMDGLTTHKKDYTPKDLQLRESFKPDANPHRSEGAFEGNTTNKSDYISWPIDKPFVHQHDQWVKPPGEMELDTTSHRDYHKHPLSKPEKYRPPSGRKVPGTFDGNTTNKTDYRKWSIGPRSMGPNRYDYKPPSGKFQGLPTYKAHYIQHQMDPARSCKPDANAMHSDAAFDDGTMYRMEFTPKEVPPCPVIGIETGRKYLYVEQDTRGHKFYSPVHESVVELSSRHSSGHKQQQMSVAF